MNIYINGIKSDIKNIFDYVKDHEDLGREISDILNDWINYHTTFYYIDSKKVYFTLI